MQVPHSRIASTYGLAGWGASVAVHLLGGAALAWWTTAPPASRPRLPGQSLVVSLDAPASLAATSETSEAGEAEIEPVEVTPQAARVARREYVLSPADVPALARAKTQREPLPVVPASPAMHPAEPLEGDPLAKLPLDLPTQTPAGAPPPIDPRPPTALPRALAAPSAASQARAPGQSERALPEPVANAPPSYPESARRAGAQGTVVLRVFITALGAVELIQIIRSSGHDALDAAAVRAVRRWRFLPAQQAGRPQAAVVRLPVRFSLDD